MKQSTRLPVYLLVAPIGEITGDMSLTALRIIGHLETLLVEDTGTQSPYGIVQKLKTMSIIKPDQRLVPIASGTDCGPCLKVVDECVAAGKPFGMLADSGMCCFNDPGVEVVSHLVKNYGETVELVPIGASSAMDAAIMMSGVDCTNFVFMGHFPETLNWYADLLQKGIPGICYVRADAGRKFFENALAEFGPGCRLTLSVFKNIRGNARRAQEHFLVRDASRRIDELVDESINRKDENQDNMVVIIHKS